VFTLTLIRLCRPSDAWRSHHRRVPIEGEETTPHRLFKKSVMLILKILVPGFGLEGAVQGADGTELKDF
jgi:hypothetical protein